MKTEFERFIDGDQEMRITLRVKDDKKTFERPTDIGWQLFKTNSKPIKNGTGISTTKTCLGSLRCVNISCKRHGVDLKPGSTMPIIQAQTLRFCTLCKQETIQHFECSVRVNFKFIDNIGFLEHKGKHTHGKYEAVHINKESILKFTQRVLECPSEKPMGLLHGTSIDRPLNPSQPVRGIDKDFQHLGKIGYHRRNVLAAYGFTVNGVAHIESLKDPIDKLNTEFPEYLKSPMDINPKTFCIPFGSPIIVHHANFHDHPIISSS